MRRPNVNGKIRAVFDRRAARAESLAEQSEAAREPLRFATHLYRVQGTAAAELESLGSALCGTLERDTDKVQSACRTIVASIAEVGPGQLAEIARSRFQEDSELTGRRLKAYWSGEATTGDDYLARAILRPYVEVLAALKKSPDRIHRPGNCPFCGGPAWVAARRALSNMDGAQRLLCCSLCGGEWSTQRIVCIACNEQDPVKLPSFQADAYPSVRIEGCETCRRYIKSIDLTEDASPIPEVDDLASIAVDVWALEQGYSRVEPGLAGI